MDVELHWDSPLHHVILAEFSEEACLRVVKILVDAGCNPRTLNSDGETVLEAAVLHGYTSVVEHLLSAYHIPLPSNILIVALAHIASPNMIRLLSQGAHLHTITSSREEEPVYLAITEYHEEDSLEVVKILISAGCNPNGQMIIDAVVHHKHPAVVEYLLSCSISLPSDILTVALRFSKSPGMIQFLLNKGARMYILTPNGDSPLHYAINTRSGYSEALCLDIVRILIDAGCNPHASNFDRETVIEAAVRRGHTSVVECLRFCNVPLPSDILTLAMQRRARPRMIRFLLDKGVSVNRVTFKKDTPLHLAVVGYSEKVCLDIVKLLTEAGCDVAACNSEGRTVIEAAVLRRYTSVAEYFLSCNIPSLPGIMTFLKRRASPQMISWLLHKGTDTIHMVPSGSDTPLHLAVTAYEDPECLDIVKILVDAGCDPAARNSFGRTVIDAAIRCDRTSVVRYLLLACNIPLPSDILSFLLRRSAGPQMIQCFLDGMDLDLFKSNGDKPLHLAITEYTGREHDCLALVKILTNAGCKLSSYGKALIEASVRLGYTSVVEYLLSCNLTLPSNILDVAVRCNATPRMFHFLLDKEIAGCDPAAQRISDEQTYSLSRNVPPHPDILKIALQQHCGPEFIELLVKKGAHVPSDAETVAHLIGPYYTGLDLVRVSRILFNDGCKDRVPNPMEETSVHAKKRRRIR